VDGNTHGEELGPHLEPGVGHDLRHGQALRGVRAQQPVDQVPHLRRPLRREGHRSIPVQ